MQSHHPLWELHTGTVEFLKSLNAAYKVTAIVWSTMRKIAFLNTPQAKVRPAVEFWLASLRATSRRASSFAISKDSRKLDRVGASCSLHFWDFTFELVLAVIDWEKHLVTGTWFLLCGFFLKKIDSMGFFF